MAIRGGDWFPDTDLPDEDGLLTRSVLTVADKPAVDGVVWRLFHDKAQYRARWALYATMKDASLLTSLWDSTNRRWMPLRLLLANGTTLPLITVFDHEPTDDEQEAALAGLQSQLHSQRAMDGVEGPG